MNGYHVGEYIQEELDARGWSVRDLAERMCNESLDVAILNVEFLLAVHEFDELHDIYLSEIEAQQLGHAFGVNPELYLNIDRTWRAANGFKPIADGFIAARRKQ